MVTLKAEGWINGGGSTIPSFGVYVWGLKKKEKGLLFFETKGHINTLNSPKDKVENQ